MHPPKKKLPPAREISKPKPLANRAELFGRTREQIAKATQMKRRQQDALVEFLRTEAELGKTFTSYAKGMRS